MSDLSEFIHGRLSPQDFVIKAAADIKKDTAFFQALPFAKTLETWAVDALAGALATKFSPTIVGLVIAQLKAALGLDPLPASPPGL